MFKNPHRDTSIHIIHIFLKKLIFKKKKKKRHNSSKLKGHWKTKAMTEVRHFPGCREENNYLTQING